MVDIDDEINNQIIVDTINILMSTNIPGQADLSLTSKTIVGTSANAAKYNEYPYITRTIKIKEGYLRNKGFIPLGEPRPALAFGGAFIAYYYHPATGMLELVENPPRWSTASLATKQLNR